MTFKMRTKPSDKVFAVGETVYLVHGSLIDGRRVPIIYEMATGREQIEDGIKKGGYFEVECHAPIGMPGDLPDWIFEEYRKFWG